MKKAEPWQKAEVSGTKKALTITTPEIIIGLIKRAKHPILAIGHEVTIANAENGKTIDQLIRFAEVSRIPVVATAHTVKELTSRGFQPEAWMPAIDFANRLRDPHWKGFDGKGSYDLAMFSGIPYYMQWLILSGLKNFAPNLKTISLDRYYQPNATWSFPNISNKEWIENFNQIERKIVTR